MPRFDWWRDWEPAFENKTHSTDLLNAEAVRVVQVMNNWDDISFNMEIHFSIYLAYEFYLSIYSKQEAKEPYFLFLSYPAVHDPLAAPERHLQMCDHVHNYRRRCHWTSP